MKNASLRALVGRRRVLSSDFKCACPGHDDAELLQELAAMVGIAVEIRDIGQVDLPHRTVPAFTACVGGEETRLRIERAKYYFPPRELIDFLNGILSRSFSKLRFVALAGGRESESVAVLTAAALAAAQAAGYRQVHPIGSPFLAP